MPPGLQQPTWNRPACSPRWWSNSCDDVLLSSGHDPQNDGLESLEHARHRLQKIKICAPRAVVVSSSQENTCDCACPRPSPAIHPTQNPRSAGKKYCGSGPGSPRDETSGAKGGVNDGVQKVIPGSPAACPWCSRCCELVTSRRDGPNRREGETWDDDVCDPGLRKDESGAVINQFFWQRHPVTIYAQANVRPRAQPSRSAISGVCQLRIQKEEGSGVQNYPTERAVRCRSSWDALRDVATRRSCCEGVPVEITQQC